MSSREAELEEITRRKKSQKFSDALSKTIDRAVDSLTPSLFYSAYSKIYEHHPNSMKILYGQLQTQLRCYITSTVRKKCIAHQVMLFIEHPEEVKGNNIKRPHTCLRRRKEVCKEPPKESRSTEILEKVRLRDQLLKKLKKMEGETSELETTMFKSHDDIVKQGVEIRKSRDVLVTGVGLLGEVFLSGREDLLELTLSEISLLADSKKRK